MKRITSIALLIAATMVSSGLMLHAAQINGSITFAGGAELDSDSAGTATTVLGWINQDGTSPLVKSSFGDFSALAPTGTPATFFAPWSFVSGAVPALWQAGGFTFDLTSSAITFQGSGFIVVHGTGTIKGNGFDPTPAVFNFSSQDPSAGGVFSISSADTAIPGCPPCAQQDIQYNFNGTQIIFQSTTGGSYVWFIADGVVNGLPWNHKVVLHISDQTITIPAAGSSPQYVVPVPDAYITFDPGVVQATTTFDTVNNVWLMTFPPSGMSGNIFYGGTAFKVPIAGLPGGIKNVDWKGSFTTDTAGLTVKWQWHAANYKNFTSNMNAIAPKPTDDTSASIYKNSDHAGTPEGTDLVSGQPWKKFVIGGGSGGGGANYTGSGSSTISFTPCICPTP